MSKHKVDTEALEFAIFREIESNKLYLTLAEASEDEQISNFFHELAEEEILHRKKLELELMKLGIVVKDKDYSEGVNLTYIAEKIPDNLSLTDVLQFAIRKESEAFRMYVNLWAKATESDTKDILLSLAEEEARHKIQFENQYQEMMHRN